MIYIGRKILWIFLLLGGGFLGYIAFGPSGIFGVTYNDTARDVFVPKGTSLQNIGRILEKSGILTHSYGFLLRAHMMKYAHRLQAGEYHIPAHTKVSVLLEHMQEGKTTKRFFTVIEGESIMEITQRLADAPFFRGDIHRIPKEGYALPASYPYHKGMQRQVMMDMMEKHMQSTLEMLWKNRPHDYIFSTKEDVLTLASLIEKETNIDLKEQPRVAGVFINRLKKGMRLQSDPTVIYALTKGHNALNRPLTKADLKVQSPYNTYIHKGLPPGPIACPRTNAIYAALHPQQHEEIYFVASGQGGHHFAIHLKDHNINVQKWRALQKKPIAPQ